MGAQVPFICAQSGSAQDANKTHIVPQDAAMKAGGEGQSVHGSVGQFMPLHEPDVAATRRRLSQATLAT